MAETDLRTYRGNCHCGAFVYEVRVPEIKKVSECVCSLCSKKGYLWVPVKRADFSIVKGDDSTLTSYTWGTKQVVHKVCVCIFFKGDFPAEFWIAVLSSLRDAYHGSQCW